MNDQSSIPPPIRRKHGYPEGRSHPHYVRAFTVRFRRRARRYRDPRSTIWTRVSMSLTTRLVMFALFFVLFTMSLIGVGYVVRGSASIDSAWAAIFWASAACWLLGSLAWPVAGWNCRTRSPRPGRDQFGRHRHASCRKCDHPRSRPDAGVCPECGEDLTRSETVIWQTPPLQHRSMSGAIAVLFTAFLLWVVVVGVGTSLM